MFKNYADMLFYETEIHFLQQDYHYLFKIK